MSLPASVNTISQNLAFDPNGINALRQTSRSAGDAGVRNVARQFEALLLQQMLKSMREAGQGFADTQSSSMRLFNSMQDQQFSQALAMKGGAGLTDAIVRQIQQQSGQAGQRSRDATSLTGFPVIGAAASAARQAAKPAATTAAGGGLADRFLEKLSGVAQEVSSSLGLSPTLVLAHAALESGWGGKSIKKADGSESYNLFGIKAGKDWNGKTVDVLTTEFIDGRMQKRIETFRAYDSYADAFQDYASLLKRRFGDAIGAGADGVGFARALQANGYATDPNYANKLAKVAQSVAARLAARQSASSQVA